MTTPVTQQGLVFAGYPRRGPDPTSENPPNQDRGCGLVAVECFAAMLFVSDFLQVGFFGLVPGGGCIWPACIANSK